MYVTPQAISKQTTCMRLWAALPCTVVTVERTLRLYSSAPAIARIAQWSGKLQSKTVLSIQSPSALLHSIPLHDDHDPMMTTKMTKKERVLQKWCSANFMKMTLPSFKDAFFSKITMTMRYFYRFIDTLGALGLRWCEVFMHSMRFLSRLYTPKHTVVV